ncbi:hypothetical protein RJ641_015264 [Dillenia turbinata]|uniref:Uncharacterized protein n=1 Tax=Dillenia turbinata TaxID=194707 RepID=A0AAN8UPD4_9MAGN
MGKVSEFWEEMSSHIKGALVKVLHTTEMHSHAHMLAQVWKVINWVAKSLKTNLTGMKFSVDFSLRKGLKLPQMAMETSGKQKQSKESDGISNLDLHNLGRLYSYKMTIHV